MSLPRWRLALSVALPLALLRAIYGYEVVREYSGSSFFDAWNYAPTQTPQAYDNTTNGDVFWATESEAESMNLTYINDDSNAVMAVSTATVVYDQKRYSVKLTSSDAYELGSLWIADIVHLPYGCSVWPSYWTAGVSGNWPAGGEIDIVENVNLATNNQYALHTTSGCAMPSNVSNLMTGSVGELDCNSTDSSGCTVSESASNSFGDAFNNNGGGVFATQFDVSGIYIWFWSRDNIPDSISSADSTSDINISSWSIPSAAYPSTSSCNITDFFEAQNLIFDITLCGDWAGSGPGGTYNDSCNTGPNGDCYLDRVLEDISDFNYDDAYFEISYIRAYTTGSASSSTATASITLTSSASGSTSSSSSSSGATKSVGHGTEGALSRWMDVVALGAMVGGAVVLGTL